MIKQESCNYAPTLLPGIELVGDLGYLLLFAAGVGAVAYIFKQPMILGFLIAGILVGPFGPLSLIKNTSMLENLSDVAIVLLLFGVGMSFPLRNLRAIGKVGTGIALIEIGVMLGIGLAIGSLFRWSFYDSIFLAAALSSSSTAAIVKVLEGLGRMESTPAILTIGVLVIEDLITVVIISTLHSSIAGGGFDSQQIALTIAKVGLFIGGTIAAGVVLVPRLISLAEKMQRYEITLMFSLGLAFALSFMSYELGFSAAVGAFLAGVAISGSRFSERITYLVAPIREIFAAIFFVTIGALMNLSLIGSSLFVVVAITAAAIFGKIGGVYGAVRIFGFEKQFALGIALSMAQLGEFSFIVLKMGQDLGAVSAMLFPVVGSVVAFTTLLGPLLTKFGSKTIAIYE